MMHGQKNIKFWKFMYEHVDYVIQSGNTRT